MGLFKGKEYKRKITELENEIIHLHSLLTPEMQEVETANKVIKNLESKANDLNDRIAQETQNLEKIKEEECRLDDILSKKREEIVETDERLLLQEFNLYEPKYDFSNSDLYKDRLNQIRSKQKEMIKVGAAATGYTNWTVNNSIKQGNKLVKDMQKLLLRAFNSECDAIIGKVKYNNFDTSVKRLQKSRDAIAKLGTIMGIAISSDYFNSKIDELTLSFEYSQKKQEEKEEQRKIREQMREEAKLQKEIEAERKKIQKEQTHYENALKSLNDQIEKANDIEKQALMLKKTEIENELLEINKAMADIDYREANQRAGYVYIISNIGSFGENVYKIGMTRRLDPTERIDELGDASVPFKFDTHAMIFSDDAPALENALHKAFEDKKLNMVNKRREFFNVTLDEIKAVVKENFDKTVEFIDIAEAEQYRVSQKIKERLT